MLVFGNILDLTNNKDNDNFINIVIELEQDDLFFDIDSFREVVIANGYENLISMLNNIIPLLLEYESKELLDKIIWLKRVLLKKNKEALLLELMSYDFKTLLTMCKEKNDELLNISPLANYKFFDDMDFTEVLSYFLIDFKNFCLNCSYEELKEYSKKIALSNLLSSTLINEDISIYLKSIIKGAIKKYLCLIYPIIQDIIKGKKEEKKREIEREKVLEKILPNTMKGQEILEFVKYDIDNLIIKELNSSSSPKKKVLKKEFNKEDNYEQLELKFN